MLTDNEEKEEKNNKNEIGSNLLSFFVGGKSWKKNPRTLDISMLKQTP